MNYSIVDEFCEHVTNKTLLDVKYELLEGWTHGDLTVGELEEIENTPMRVIPERLYRELMLASSRYHALEEHGVNQWEKYKLALTFLRSVEWEAGEQPQINQVI